MTHMIEPLYFKSILLLQIYNMAYDLLLFIRRFESL